MKYVNINHYFLAHTEYKILTKIGEGSFSEVLKVESKKNGEFYAAKKLTQEYQWYVYIYKQYIHIVILKTYFISNDFLHSMIDVLNCTELSIIRSLAYHPNVIGIVDTVL